jgi:hypothetical protein
MSIYVSLIVALVSAVLFLVLPAPPTLPRDKFSELCRLAFAVSLLAFLLVVGGHITSLFGK